MTRAARRQQGPPRELELPALAAFTGPGLEPRGDYEALAFADLDLAGADGSGASFAGCRFERCRLDDAVLAKVRLSGCVLVEVGATGLDMTESAWRDTIMAGSRIGALAALRSEWSSVRIRGGKLDFLALAGGRLDDVAFEDCVIDELDLGDARLASVTFAGCRIGVLDVAGARLRAVDLSGAAIQAVRGIAGLRGATVSPAQLVEMAPLLAHHLGIVVTGEA